MANSPATGLQTNQRVDFGVDTTAISEVCLLLDGTIVDLVLSRNKRSGR